MTPHGTERGRRNIAMRLAYDGTAYHGWQAQKNDVTVSETLERALEGAVGHPVRVTGCGRTDAGVHARTYVANFRTESGIPAERLPYAVNTRLPRDIAVYSASDVAEDFHATFSATAKEYTYVISPSRIHDPFLADRAYFYPRTPDVARMRAAAEMLVGEHDFAALRSVGSNVKTTVRTMYELEVREEGGTVLIRMKANGFLYNMARAISGTLLYVSEGKLSPEDIPALLEAGERTAAGPTLPACGLYMTGVWYRENI